MVNFQLNLASIVGIALAIGGAALYAMRSVRPELSRDYDLFFAAVALLCGGILFFYGWRFDPIMQFGQILLGGSAIFFAFENFRLRGVTTVQAKRQAPIVDDERPVSRVYRVDAELDEIEPVEVRPVNRRIRGSDEQRGSRSQTYEEPTRRRPPSRGSSFDRPSSDDRPAKRRPRPAERPSNGRPEEWEAGEDREERPPRRSRPGSPSREPAASSARSDRNSEERSPRRKRNDIEATPTDYVDYEHIDSPDDETDNSGNFDS